MHREPALSCVYFGAAAPRRPALFWRLRVRIAGTASLIALLTGVLAGRADAATPQIGQPAPPLAVERLLHAPDGARADWESLNGKIVVLDFWATWCGPCVQAIPALNKLEQSLADKPVQFISITDESASVVLPFLARTPIEGWVALDTDGSVFRAYGVQGRPAIAIVDTGGRLVGWTHPFALINRPQILSDLLAGKTVKLAASPESEAFTPDASSAEPKAEDRAEPPLCLIRIARSRGDDGRFTPGTRSNLTLNEVTVRTAISRIWDVQRSAIVGSAALPEDERYDILFRWPRHDLRAGTEALQQAIQSAFGIRVHRERREMDVYVLSVPEVQALKLEPTMSAVFFDPQTGHSAASREMLDRMNAGETFFRAMGDSGALARNLGDTFSQPVLDDAQFEGYYSFHHPYNFEKPDPQALIQGLEKNYGVKLLPERREMDVLVVDKVSQEP